VAGKPQFHSSQTATGQSIAAIVFLKEETNQGKICIFISSILVKKNMGNKKKGGVKNYPIKGFNEELHRVWREIVSRNGGNLHAALREWMDVKKRS